MKFQGVYAALLTPMDEQGATVDLARLQDLARDVVAGGVSGVMVNGTTGEFSSLTESERRENVEAVSDAVAADATVIVNAGAITTTEAVRHTEHAKEHEADAVMLAMPYHIHLNREEMIDHVTAVTKVGPPVILYRIPEYTGYDFPLDVIAECAQLPNVVGIKESGGSLVDVQDLMALCGDSLQILMGWDGLIYPALTVGVRATVWGVANVAPAACASLLRRVLAEDWSAAVKEWWQLYPLVRFAEDNGYVSSLKAGCALRGLDVGSPRPPLRPLASERRAELDKIVTAVAPVGVAVSS